MAKEMWLVVGLGNPGTQYANTRHNAGFILLDEVCRLFNGKVGKPKFNGKIFEVEVGDKSCIFLKPQTFMNLSGYSVFNVAKYYKIPLDRILVLHDDTNFQIGKFKIKQNGSSGGHNGVGNIIEEFGSEKFVRVKIGVNEKPNQFIDLKDWVVSRFSKVELQNLLEIAPKIKEVIELFVNGQIDKAMNKYNTK